MPTLEVTQHDAMAMSCDIICRDERQKRLLRMLFRKSGVQTRRTVIPWKTAYFWNRDGAPGERGPSTGERMKLYERYAAPLATAAGRRALGQSSPQIDDHGTHQATATLHSDGGFESESWRADGDDGEPLAGRVTHLVTVSCTGFSSPGVDLHLQETLGLAPTVQRVHVGFMGCHGAINGLRVARGLAAADPNAVVLVVAVELCSLHYRMTWEDDAMVGNALFADGAAAAVVAGRNLSSAFPEAPRILDTGSIRIPESDDQMAWRIGDHGFDMTLTGQVPSSIAEHLSRFMNQWLQQRGICPESVRDWIVHPGGPRILDAAEAALGLGAGQLDRSRAVLSRLGNMSSPTVLFVLRQALASAVSQSAESQKGGPRVVLAFGPGLVAEVALLG